MITDAELFLRLEQLKNEKNWDWEAVAELLNISIPTLFAWKKGRKMSLKGRRAILAITEEDAGNFRDVTPSIPSCPFLAIVQERWKELSTEERAEIAGKVAPMADHKKDSTSMEEA